MEVIDDADVCSSGSEAVARALRRADGVTQCRPVLLLPWIVGVCGFCRSWRKRVKSMPKSMRARMLTPRVPDASRMLCATRLI